MRSLNPLRQIKLRIREIRQQTKKEKEEIQKQRIEKRIQKEQRKKEIEQQKADFYIKLLKQPNTFEEFIIQVKEYRSADKRGLNSEMVFVDFLKQLKNKYSIIGFDKHFFISIFGNSKTLRKYLYNYSKVVYRNGQPQFYILI